MTFEQLEPEQRDTYLNFERTLRAFSGKLQRLLNEAEAINVAYNAQMQGILADLDDKPIVPNSSGLAGSQALDSDAEMVTLVSHIQSLIHAQNGFNTTGHKNLRVKAAGLANTLGT